MHEVPVEQIDIENEDGDTLTVTKFGKQTDHASGTTTGRFVFRTHDGSPVRYHRETDIFEVHDGDEWVKYKRVAN